MTQINLQFIWQKKCNQLELNDDEERCLTYDVSFVDLDNIKNKRKKRKKSIVYHRAISKHYDEQDIQFSAEERNSLVEEAKNLILLEKSWDGYGAPTLSICLIKNAIYFLRLLPNTFPLPRLDFSADDEIIFSWESTEQAMDLTIQANDHMRLYHIRYGTPPGKQHKQYFIEQFLSSDSITKALSAE